MKAREDENSLYFARTADPKSGRLDPQEAKGKQTPWTGTEARDVGDGPAQPSRPPVVVGGTCEVP